MFRNTMNATKYLSRLHYGDRRLTKDARFHLAELQEQFLFEPRLYAECHVVV